MIVVDRNTGEMTFTGGDHSIVWKGDKPSAVEDGARYLNYLGLYTTYWPEYKDHCIRCRMKMCPMRLWKKAVWPEKKKYLNELKAVAAAAEKNKKAGECHIPLFQNLYY